MAKITVIAAVLDRGILSLYKADGSTYVIEQGDKRLEDIVRLCVANQAVLSTGGSIEVDVGGEDETFNAYKAYEDKSGGFVKLFRVAKSALASFFAAKPSVPTSMAVGQIPEPKQMPVIPVGGMFVTQTDLAAEKEARDKLMAVQPMLPETKLSHAVEEIMAKATPVSHETFDDSNVGTKGDQSETIIAVVDGQVIGGMEQLKPQMAHASQSDAKGFNAFMKRIAAVAAKRNHSVDDLLKFMQRGDLPIADDGTIVIYKVLRRDGDHYVDCHSGNVKQKIGSYVHMDEKLVDHDRRNECSNGLHVARRAYVGNFSGDVVVLAKVAPEDVIAVPQYDANKMRVCGYHILFELSAEGRSLVRSNKPMTSSKADAMLLGRALGGDHDEPIEDVKITGQYGAGLIITPRNAPVVETPKVAEVREGVALDTDKDDNRRPLVAKHVDAKSIAKEVTEVKKTLSRAEQAEKLFRLFEQSRGAKARKENANALLLFKQSSKVSWTKLGLSETLTETLKNAVAAG